MKGSDEWRAAIGHAVAHFFGGFVGKSDGDDILRFDAGFQQINQAAGKGAGFSGTGSSRD